MTYIRLSQRNTKVLQIPTSSGQFTPNIVVSRLKQNVQAQFILKLGENAMINRVDAMYPDYKVQASNDPQHDPLPLIWSGVEFQGQGLMRKKGVM